MAKSASETQRFCAHDPKRFGSGTTMQTAQAAYIGFDSQPLFCPINYQGVVDFGAGFAASSAPQQVASTLASCSDATASGKSSQGQRYDGADTIVINGEIHSASCACSQGHGHVHVAHGSSKFSGESKMKAPVGPASYHATMPEGGGSHGSLSYVGRRLSLPCSLGAKAHTLSTAEHGHNTSRELLEVLHRGAHRTSELESQHSIGDHHKRPSHTSIAPFQATTAGLESKVGLHSASSGAARAIEQQVPTTLQAPSYPHRYPRRFLQLVALTSEAGQSPSAAPLYLGGVSTDYYPEAGGKHQEAPPQGWGFKSNTPCAKSDPSPATCSGAVPAQEACPRSAAMLAPQTNPVPSSSASLVPLEQSALSSEQSSPKPSFYKHCPQYHFIAAIAYRRKTPEPAQCSGRSLGRRDGADCVAESPWHVAHLQRIESDMAAAERTNLHDNLDWGAFLDTVGSRFADLCRVCAAAEDWHAIASSEECSVTQFQPHTRILVRKAGPTKLGPSVYPNDLSKQAVVRDTAQALPQWVVLQALLSPGWQFHMRQLQAPLRRALRSKQHLQTKPSSMMFAHVVQLPVQALQGASEAVSHSSKAELFAGAALPTVPQALRTVPRFGISAHLQSKAHSSQSVVHHMRVGGGAAMGSRTFAAQHLTAENWVERTFDNAEAAAHHADAVVRLLEDIPSTHRVLNFPLVHLGELQFFPCSSAVQELLLSPQHVAAAAKAAQAWGAVFFKKEQEAVLAGAIHTALSLDQQAVVSVPPPGHHWPVKRMAAGVGPVTVSVQSQFVARHSTQGMSSFV